MKEHKELDELEAKFRKEISDKGEEPLPHSFFKDEFCFQHSEFYKRVILPKQREQRVRTKEVRELTKIKKYDQFRRELNEGKPVAEKIDAYFEELDQKKEEQKRKQKEKQEQRLKNDGEEQL